MKIQNADNRRLVQAVLDAEPEDLEDIRGCCPEDLEFYARQLSTTVDTLVEIGTTGKERLHELRGLRKSLLAEAERKRLRDRIWRLRIEIEKLLPELQGRDVKETTVRVLLEGAIENVKKAYALVRSDVETLTELEGVEGGCIGDDSQ